MGKVNEVVALGVRELEVERFLVIVSNYSFLPGWLIRNKSSMEILKAFENWGSESLDY